MLLLLLKRRFLLLVASLAWFVAKRVIRRRLAVRASKQAVATQKPALDRVLAEIERLLRGP